MRIFCFAIALGISDPYTVLGLTSAATPTEIDLASAAPGLTSQRVDSSLGHRW